MNIAPVTILLLLLLFPGIFFSRFYFTEEFSKQYFKTTLYELLLTTLLPALLIHLVALFIVKIYLNIEVDLATILAVFLDTGISSNIIGTIESSASNMISYNISVWVFAGFLGYATKKVVRRFKLDRKFKLFRFSNEWHYLITGEILDFPKIEGEANDIDVVFIDALIGTGEGTIIYSGIIQDYKLSKQGGLESLYLTQVYKRFLKEDGLVNKPFIPGDFMVLPYKDVINLNITYYSFETIDDESVEEIAE